MHKMDGPPSLKLQLNFNIVFFVYASLVESNKRTFSLRDKKGGEE